MRTAIYPGTFDPFTNGHADVAERALKIADQVIIAVAEALDKKPLFSHKERITLVQRALKNVDNIQVIGFKTLLLDFIKKWQTPFIIRGLRTASDFDYELQLVNMTQLLAPEIDFVFLMSSKANGCISSSIIKEIAALGGDLSPFVHPDVQELLINKVQRR